MKLARKLTLFLVLGMCLILGVDCWLSIRRELQLHIADMRRDQHITGQALSVAFADLWKRGGREQALTLVDRAKRASGQAYVRWVEFDVPPGSRLSPQLTGPDLEPVRRGREIQRTIDEPHGPGRFLTYVPVRVDGAIPGALELTESLAENRRYVQVTILRRIATAAALAALSGLLAILLGTLFVGRPIRSLIDKTRRIAAGDLSRSLELHPRDEIGELVGAINAMCVKLEGARTRIAAETSARIEAIEQMRHGDRLATVGRLASGIAHELGTPLNVTLQRAKMISTGEVTGLEAADGARIIADQARRMTAVVRQLLDFARRHTPHKARHDLVLVVRQTVEFLTPVAEQRGVTLRVEGDANGAQADVDAGQIQQALTNLVVNGIQAIEGGGEVAIHVGTGTVRPPADHGGAEGRFVVLSVRDRGPGILPEHLPHVFEPFFTTKRPGEGTGLGLAVARGIVQDHAGWMECESTPGWGCRFSMFLPASPAADRPGFSAAPSRVGAAVDGPVEAARPEAPAVGGRA